MKPVKANHAFCAHWACARTELGEKMRPRAFRNARDPKAKLFQPAVLITAAGLVDLNVARGDNRRVNGAIPDLQVAARDANEEQVASSAPIVIIYRTPDKGNRDLRQRVASDTGHDAIAMEVNDVNDDLRGSGRAAHAVVNDDMLALEMNARIVVDHVPVATIRSLGTAAGIHDAAVAEVR